MTNYDFYLKNITEYPVIDRSFVVDWNARTLFFITKTENCYTETWGSEEYDETIAACEVGEGLLEFCEADFGTDGADLSQSLYAAVFAPQNAAEYSDYLDRMRNLQRIYRETVHFCFDYSLYGDDLSKIDAMTRFHIYAINGEVPKPQAVATTFSTRRVMLVAGDFEGRVFTKNADYSLPDARFKEYSGEFALKSRKKRAERNTFEKALNLPVSATELNEILPAVSETRSLVNSLEAALYFEFTAMLRLNLRIKRCRSCNRCFVLKGNYPTEYCDKIPAGETKTCQTLAAITNYNRKVSENPALGLYNKYYKRGHSRVKTGTMSRERFEAWKRDALKMRERCLKNKMSLEDFESFLSENLR